MRLKKLIEECKRHFWAQDTYEDDGRTYPAVLFAACWDVVTRDICTVKLASHILAELSQQNTPLPENPEANAENWLKFFQGIIIGSLTKYLELDPKLSQESTRRQRMY